MDIIRELLNGTLQYLLSLFVISLFFQKRHKFQDMVDFSQIGLADQNTQHYQTYFFMFFLNVLNNTVKLSKVILIQSL